MISDSAVVIVVDYYQHFAHLSLICKLTQQGHNLDLTQGHHLRFNYCPQYSHSLSIILQQQQQFTALKDCCCCYPPL